MAFSATKRELGELYTFFRLLADGAVSLGTPEARTNETEQWPVALIQREEHDGTRRYYIEEENIRIVSGATGKDGNFVPPKKLFCTFRNCPSSEKSLYCTCAITL